MHTDVFGFAENEGIPTYGLGYKLTLAKNKDDAVLYKSVALADDRIKIDHIHWYVPHYTYYTLSVQQQSMSSIKILLRTPTELSYTERSVFMKKLNSRSRWNFELVSQENMNVSVGIVIRFQQRDRQDSQI